MSHQPNYTVGYTNEETQIDVDSLQVARSISNCINDGEWAEKLYLVPKSPTYIQYNTVPDDVLKYEDLFDMELTDRLGVLLTNEESTLGQTIQDRVRVALTYQGELTPEETHIILSDMDELELLEGISLRKINIERITEILTTI